MLRELLNRYKILDGASVGRFFVGAAFWELLYISWYIEGLAQDCSNSIANALELLQFALKKQYIHTFMVFCSVMATFSDKMQECTDYYWILWQHWSQREQQNMT